MSDECNGVTMCERGDWGVMDGDGGRGGCRCRKDCIVEGMCVSVWGRDCDWGNSPIWECMDGGREGWVYVGGGISVCMGGEVTLGWVYASGYCGVGGRSVLGSWLGGEC